MRGSVTTLQYEHGIIRQVTDVLADMVRRETLKKHAKHTAKIAEFLHSYVSKYHHVKEERFLFRLASGISADLSAEAERLRADHGQVNALIDRMRQLSKRKEAYADGTLAHVSKEIVEAVTAHVRHEEDVYYPKVEEAMSMEQDADLLVAYGEYDREFGPGFLRSSEDFAVKVQDEVLGPGYYKGIQ